MRKIVNFMHFSFVKSNKMYYPISTTIIDIYLLIWCGVTKYYLVLLKCLLLRNFLCSAHAPKLEATNINCLRSIMPRARASFFSERIINTWNSLPESVVDFSSLPRFTFNRYNRLLGLVGY